MNLFARIVSSHLSLFRVLRLIIILIVAACGLTLYTKYTKVNSSPVLNSPPTANADTYQVHGSFDSININQPDGVLHNDSDPDPGDGVRSVGFSSTNQLGTATVADIYGRTMFSPSYGQTGTVTYPYTVCDTHNACSSSTVTFNVTNQVPAANADAYEVHGSFDSLTANVPGALANDSDPDNGDVLTGIDTQPVQTALGTGRITSSGRATFSPLYGAVGSVSIPYTVCDNLGGCSNTTVTFNVLNQTPLAIEDNYVVPKNNNGIDTPVGFLFRNDVDPENDQPFTAYGAIYDIPEGSSTPHSRVYIYATGKAGYIKLNPNFWGTVSVPYTVCDGLGRCSQSSVTFHVLAGGAEDNSGVNCPAVGNPVNPTNGNMWLRQTDYQLSTPVGRQIEVTRTYNSFQQWSGGLFGLGWMTQYDQFILAADDRLVRVFLSDGRAVFFGRTNTTSAFTPIDGKDIHASLAKNSNGSYTLTFKDGLVNEYNSAGRLTALKDRNNNQTTLAYDQVTGKLNTITDTFGRVLTFGYHLSGFVGQISDSMGIAATYDYLNGELKSVVYPENSRYDFTYDTVANMRVLTLVKDASGNIVEKHQYYGNGKAMTSEVQGGNEKYTLAYISSAETHVTDARGNVTKYFLDSSKVRNVVTKIEGLCGCSGSGGSESALFEYDDNLNLKKRTDALNRQTNYTYDGNGNPLTVIDTWGTQSYTYNQFGQVLTYTDRMTGVATNEYDVKGNLKKVTDALNHVTNLDYEPNGLLKSVTDARGNKATLKWDNTGKLEYVEDPYLNKTQYTFDARLRLKTVTDAKSHTTTYDYDPLGRLKEILYHNQDKITYSYNPVTRTVVKTDARNYTTTYNYDSANRLWKVTDHLGRFKEFQYNLMSNLISSKDSLGNVTNYEYDEFNRLNKIIHPLPETGVTRLEETFKYDPVGRIKEHKDTAQRLTIYAYDDINRINQVTRYSANQAQDEITKTKYNQRFQTIEIIDDANQKYEFTYNPFGRVLSQTRAGSTMTYEYDEVGNRKKRTDYIGRVTHYKYDKLNRLEKTTYGDPVSANEPPNLEARYIYDEVSRLTSAVNEAGTITFGYDTRDRLISTTDVFGHTLQYDYDGNNNRKWVKLDGVTYATYQYDEINRIKIITNSADSTVVNYNYDDANKTVTRAFPNGVTATYKFDGMGRIKQLKDATSSTTLFDRQYAYNSANRISQITEPSGSRTFGYDGFDRLSSVTNGATNESYDYDSVGNRSSSHLSSSYGYQPFNRLTATSTASYDYDSNGNMTIKREGSKRWTYYWDYENRLSFASDRKTIARYTYDALGRRVARHAKAKGGSTKFIYDGRDVLLDDNDGVLTKYLNGRGVDKKLRAQTGTGISYFLVDQLGSTTGLADTSGNLTASTGYDSFGNATNQNFPTRYQFTGRELDSFTGLHYYRARQYDANLGRFISEDPIGFAGGDINLYGYVWNSPQDFTDPTGHGGWGSDAADWLDERIEEVRRYNTSNELEWEANGVNNSVADVAMGFTNLLRVGNGIGYALYNCDDNIYGRMAYVAMDVERASAIFSMLAGPFAGRVGIPRQRPIPGKGYHKETIAPKPVKPENAVEEMENFLGEGPYTNKHPRTGEPDPNRLVSADGKRSIRYGDHEMDSTPTKHHYHEETWTYDEVNNVMNVDNRVIRVPLKKKK